MLRINLKRMARVSTLAAVAATSFIIPASASASVTFDPDTGTGFVGKGDVQYTYGWNNATLQNLAAGVDFAYSAERDYDVTCEFDTEQIEAIKTGTGKDTVVERIVVRKHHVTTQDLSTSLARDLTTVTRKNPQGSVNGFLLNGIDTTVESGDDVPEVGDACLGQGVGTIDPRVTAVDLVSSTGGLLVSSAGGTPTPLLSPPALV